MSFFLLSLDPAYDKLDELLFILNSAPNGYMINGSNEIYCSLFTPLRRIYWVQEFSITPTNIDIVRNMGGVIKFEKIEDVPVTPRDKEWKFEDDYIYNLFLPYFQK